MLIYNIIALYYNCTFSLVYFTNLRSRNIKRKLKIKKAILHWQLGKRIGISDGKKDTVKDLYCQEGYGNIWRMGTNKELERILGELDTVTEIKRNLGGRRRKRREKPWKRLVDVEEDLLPWEYNSATDKPGKEMSGIGGSDLSLIHI